MKNKGFSFIELLVAVAILGIISLPIVSSFALAAKIDAKASAVSGAANAVDDVLLLLTELDHMPDYGDPIEDTGKTYDLLWYLDSYASKGYLTYSKITEVQSNGESSGETEVQENGTLRYTIKYQGYPIELTVTDCTGFYRIDLSLAFSSGGDAMHISRKGVLPYAKS